jgi:hypothetical protein
MPNYVSMDVSPASALHTTAVLASPQKAIKTGKFTDVGDMTSLKTFVTSFAGHIAAEAARR